MITGLWLILSVMKKTIKTERLPIRLWLDDIEPGALKQAKNVANLPFAFSHLAVMPDAHEGYGMPIGGVLATHNVIIPNAVGVDIGCGMCAVRSSLRDVDPEVLKQIILTIRDVIPVGFRHHKKAQEETSMPVNHHVEDMKVIRREYLSARHQLGTLGGGNHFIELQRSEDGHLWVMIHSGSRNLGKQVADHYNRVAKQLNEKWSRVVDPMADLAWMPLDIPEAADYLREMNYCVQFAFANRRRMMETVTEIISDSVKGAVDFAPIINIAHNYASLEHHFGHEVMVHRKGATSAREGETGIIPGSQGTKSYIVEGLGNPESFMSCSHGAGRKMGRKQAQKQLDFHEEVRKLDEQGILHGIKSHHDLDEASGAYKDIEQVMANQEDLVRIATSLKPLAVVKG
jgi:tRNA-splicing ligase RtcB (3'-phosphate/5'-hydroxy nucleic acid ligase)